VEVPATPSKYEPQQRPERSKYLLAEELAIRALEAEFGAVARRQVAISAAGMNREFDAVLQKPRPSDIIAVEVRFLTGGKARLDVISDALDRAAFLKNLVGPPPKLVLAIVTEQNPLLAEQMRAAFTLATSKSEPLDVEIRTFDLSELEKRFGVAPANSP